MKINQDIIDDIVTRLCSVLPEPVQAHVERVARDTREAWGGDRVFISKRPGEGRSERNQSILRDYQRGERLALLARRYGLTERRILQIIKG